MRIVVINGSPKKKRSASESFISKIEEISGFKFEKVQAIEKINAEDLSDIIQADVLLFVFPLYIDSLPAPLTKLLTRLENAKTPSPYQTQVFAICNCGFYEASHTRLALSMIKNFSKRAGLTYRYGIGIGSGAYVGQLKNITKGPAQNVYKALCAMGSELLNPAGSEAKDVFVTPGMPRILYKLGGHKSWKKAAKKNGALSKLRDAPHKFLR